MLYLTRKIGESIIINNHIELTVTEIHGKSVKLGFVFPPDASILRKELYDKIMAQNLAAAADEGDLGDIRIDLAKKQPEPKEPNDKP